MIEEVTKVATGVVDSLKGQPLALALIIINLLYIGAGVWVWHGERNRRTELVTTVLQSCLDLENKRGFTWSPQTTPDGSRRGTDKGLGNGFK